MTEAEYNEKKTALENAARKTVAAFNANIEAQLAAKDARIAELEAENARLRAELAAIQNRHPLQAAEDAINALRNL